MIDFGKISQYIGYASVISGALWAAWKFAFFLYMDVKRKTEKLNPRNIDHIKDIAYRALHKSETALDWINAAVYVCRPSGECIYASVGLCTLFGLDYEDMLGYGWTLAIPEPHRARAADNWEKHVKNHRPYQDTYPVIVGGNEIQVWTKTEICYDFNPAKPGEHGEIMFYIGIVKVLQNAQ